MHVSAKNNQICFYHIELIMLAYIYSNTRLIKMHGLIRQTHTDHLVSAPYWFSRNIILECTYLSERSLVIFSIPSWIVVCEGILHLAHLMVLGVWEEGGKRCAACGRVGLLGGGNSVVQVSTSPLMFQTYNVYLKPNPSLSLPERTRHLIIVAYHKIYPACVGRP